MKFFFITKEPFPEGLAATSRIKCYIKALQADNARCELIIYSRTESSNSDRNAEANGNFEGIHFQYIGGTTRRKDSFLYQQIINYKDKFTLLRYLWNNIKKGDVVFGYASKDSFFINRLIDLVHLKGGKYVRDLCELPYGTGKETFKAKLLRKYAIKVQFRKCDGIVAISDTLMELVHTCSPKTRLIKVPIMVEFEKYCIQNKSNQSPYPYIFHAGSLQQQKDGILGMLKAFSILVREYPNCKFVSTGKLQNSPNSMEISNLIQKEAIENKVLFLGYLNQQELNDYLSKATAVIINKSMNQQNTYCFSNKLGEYMAAGKPVVITEVGEAVNWIKDGYDALVVPPDNPYQIALSLKMILDDTSLQNSLSKNARLTCENSFDYHVYATRLKNFVCNL